MKKNFSSIGALSVSLSGFSILADYLMTLYIKNIFTIKYIENMQDIKGFAIYGITIMLIWVCSLLAMGFGIGAILKYGKKEILGIAGLVISFLYYIYVILMFI